MKSDVKLGTPPKSKMDLMSLLKRRKQTLEDWISKNLQEDKTYDACCKFCKIHKLIPPSSHEWTLHIPVLSPRIVPTPTAPVVRRNALIQMPQQIASPSLSEEDDAVNRSRKPKKKAEIEAVSNQGIDVNDAPITSGDDQTGS